jgi:hypothetical protein
MAPHGCTAALLACLALLLLSAGGGSEAALAGGHERACAAATGVLRRCVGAADSSQADVHDRCCTLLQAFERNGCLW